MRASWLIYAGCMIPGLLSGKVLSGVFADGMVLQRDVPVPVWGMAQPGETVTVEFAGQSKSTQVTADGKWMIRLDPMPANAGGAEMRVRSPAESVSLKDILVGEVWFCSGQSNMASTMKSLEKAPDYAGDLTSADHPLIRHAAVPRTPSLQPLNETAMKWVVCSPQSVGEFTAAGFYFAREIRQQLDVPVGLILAAWGGTSAETWVSKEALDRDPGFKKRAEKQIANVLQLPQQIEAFPASLKTWEQANGRVDPGNEGEKNGWHLADRQVPGGKLLPLKTAWKNAGLPDGGIGWIRKEIVVPASGSGKAFRIDFGQIDEAYATVYFNGQKLGDFGTEPPSFYKSYAHFDVPASLVKEGTNLLAVRFRVHTGQKPPLNRGFDSFGFKALGSPSVGDECQFVVEKTFPPLTPEAMGLRPPVPEGGLSGTSSGLFGGMVHPLIPFAFRGVLWYQGEQDGSRGFAYRRLLPILIQDWRQRWGRGDFPFLVQQLPNWAAAGAETTGWAELREAQALTADTVAQCHLSVAIDIGDSNNVHPVNKRDVGRRLALVALREVYGRPVEAYGPVYESMAIEGSSVRLKFRHAGGLKSADGGTLKRFAIAGEDRKFVYADARIDGDSVVVSHADVPAPVAARYAFVNDPVGCNLTNASGLPARPFRTDDWPGESINRE
ncbi:MAG: sialate O-acetylesterase [Candidatus Methylacidiphilales bacterium]|nr:sialate O-acetylesterase [Candidatus Methylacidiphilales bacterium]